MKEQNKANGDLSVVTVIEAHQSLFLLNARMKLFRKVTGLTPTSPNGAASGSPSRYRTRRFMFRGEGIAISVPDG